MWEAESPGAPIALPQLTRGVALPHWERYPEDWKPTGAPLTNQGVSLRVVPAAQRSCPAGETHPKRLHIFNAFPQILSSIETLLGKFKLRGGPPNNGYFSGQLLRVSW